MFEVRQVLTRMRLGDTDRAIARAGMMGLQARLDESRSDITYYFEPRVLAVPPPELSGPLLNGEVTREAARSWIGEQLPAVTDRGARALYRPAAGRHRLAQGGAGQDRGRIGPECSAQEGAA